MRCDARRRQRAHDAQMDLTPAARGGDILSVSMISEINMFLNSGGAEQKSFSTTLDENFCMLSCIIRPAAGCGRRARVRSRVER